MIVYSQENDREALRELTAQAESFAKQAMMKVGEVPPTLFIQTNDGPVMFSARGGLGEEDKDKFAEAARLMCVAHRATAAVFVAEGWTRFAKKGETLDLTKMPSQCPDRQEILMFMGEAWQATSQKLVPILRSDSGKFVGYGEAHSMEADQVLGRFAEFLPQKYPSLEEQHRAKEILQSHVQEMRHDRGEERGHARF